MGVLRVDRRTVVDAPRRLRSIQRWFGALCPVLQRIRSESKNPCLAEVVEGWFPPHLVALTGCLGPCRHGRAERARRGRPVRGARSASSARCRRHHRLPAPARSPWFEPLPRWPCPCSTRRQDPPMRSPFARISPVNEWNSPRRAPYPALRQRSRPIGPTPTSRGKTPRGSRGTGDRRRCRVATMRLAAGPISQSGAHAQRCTTPARPRPTAGDAAGTAHSAGGERVQHGVPHPLPRAAAGLLLHRDAHARALGLDDEGDLGPHERQSPDQHHQLPRRLGC
jgi:hypothetical protein